MGRTVEINLQRLLSHCETLASDAQHKETKVNWRLSKYLKSAENQISTLENDTKIKLPEDVLQEYKRKVTFLKDIVKADEVQNPLERTLMCQHLLPSSIISSYSNDHEDNNLKAKELHLQIKGRHQKDLRNELFGGETEEHKHSLRKRKGGADDSSTKENIDDIIKQHHDMQEKAAEEMIRMAQAMKHTSLRSRDIIKADKTELERSTKVVEQNFVKLKEETARLEELNNRRCAWTMWIMLGIVCVVFVNMIIFMKFFPKRKNY